MRHLLSAALSVLILSACGPQHFQAVDGHCSPVGSIEQPLTGIWIIQDTLQSQAGTACNVDHARVDLVSLAMTPDGLYSWTNGFSVRALDADSHFNSQTGQVRALSFWGGGTLVQEDRDLRLTDEVLAGTTKLVVGDSSGNVFCVATYETTGQRQ